MNKSNESLYIEINLRRTQWLPGKLLLQSTQKQNYFSIKYLSKNLDWYYFEFKNIIVFGDFSATFEESALKTFCDSFNLKNVFLKEPAYPKSKESYLH